MNRKNSFDAIRLIAAIFVVFSHSFALTGNTAPKIGSTDFGTLGVWIFFILSGYLISKSWKQYPRLGVFLQKRMLRIFPALAVAVIATIILGAFVTTLSTSDYLTNPGTWAYVNNILLYNTNFYLPGVYENNPIAGGINGSLWTLAYEFTMYIVVALIGITGMYKKVSPLFVWAGLMAASLIILIIGRDNFTLSLFYLNISQLIIFAYMFFTGIMVYKYEKIIPQNIGLFAASIVLLIITIIFIPALTVWAVPVFIGYAVFYLGRLPWGHAISKVGDLSYGVYIYSFPIQQTIWHVTQTQSSLKMFLLSTVLSMVVAYASWQLIEVRALSMKNKINHNRYPIDQETRSW